MGTRIRRSLAFALAAAVALVIAMPGVAQAAYFFRPGEPMFFGSPGNLAHYCTGGYAVRGTDGLFLLTAGHCDVANRAVYGTDARFGTVAFTKYPGDDTALVRLTAGNDAYQIVVDPLTGRVPGGTGKVVGYLATSNFTTGYLIGKMGRTTGWTEGAIYGQLLVEGQILYCSRARVDDGDSGGPVWRTAPGGGVYAAGIVVAKDLSTGGTCFAPIARLLQVWGATLPRFSSGARAVQPTPELPAADPLPFIYPSRLATV